MFYILRRYHLSAMYFMAIAASFRSLIGGGVSTLGSDDLSRSGGESGGSADQLISWF